MPAPQALLDQMRRLAPTVGPQLRVALGPENMDAALSGGLTLGALHEVFAVSAGDVGAATGFALALATKAARSKPLLWARQDMLDVETGQVYAPGLAEMGVTPGAVVLVRGRDAEDVLKAGEDAVRCAGLGAVIVQPWGDPARLNLTTSRRLVLAAAASGVTAVMLRIAAAPRPSAAETRWHVAAAPSRLLESDAPDLPAFNVTLLRQRGGNAGGTWCLEWRRDVHAFDERGDRAAASLSRFVAPVFAGGTAEETLRRTG